jgi:hypothetical protein
MLTLEEDNPRFTKKYGTDGTVTRSKVLARGGKSTVKLMSSSEVNDQLSAVAQADLDAPNGAGVGVFEVKDLNGTSLHHAAEAWIAEVPKPDWDKEANGREWVIEFARIESFHGGNFGPNSGG